MLQCSFVPVMERTTLCCTTATYNLQRPINFQLNCSTQWNTAKKKKNAELICELQGKVVFHCYDSCLNQPFPLTAEYKVYNDFAISLGSIYTDKVEFNA